jgi:hypothetical protein
MNQSKSTQQQPAARAKAMSKRKKQLKRAKKKMQATTRDRSPKWDGDLPRTKPEIKEAMHRILREHSHELTAPAPPVFHPDGSKTVPMSPRMVELMRLQKQLFRATFNREPGRRDPMFWDHDREHEGPKPIDAEKMARETRKDMVMAGIRPEMAYAHEKTGMIITESNLHLFTEEQIEEWEEAVAEYQRTN